MEDQLAQVLTDLERLIEIWVDLDKSEAACNGVTTLIAKRVEDVRSSNIVTASNVTPKNLERLVALKLRVLILGNNHAINISITALCEFLIIQKTAAHRVLTGTLKDHRRGRSELEQCEELSECIAIRTLIETYFDNAGECLEEINKVIDGELHSLHARVVDNHDAISLKVLELCARIRKGLSEPQRQFIDRIIAGKISSLKGSQSVSLDPSAKPKERPTKPLTASTHHTEAVTSQVQSEDINKLGNTIQQLEADKKGLLNEKTSLETRLWESARKLEAEKARYQEMVVKVRTEEKQKYEELITTFKEDKDNYDRSPMEVRKLVEALSEVEDDRSVLLKNNDMLRFENEHLEKHRVDTIAETALLLEQLADLSTKCTGLTEEVKTLSDTLEDAEDDKVGLSRSIDKLNDENNRLLKKLANSRKTVKEMKSYVPAENLDKLSLENAKLESEIIEMKERLDRHKTSTSAKNLAKLKVENLRQEKELAHAREQLSHIQPTQDPETLCELGEDQKCLEEELACANTSLDTLRSFLAHLATVTAAYAASGVGINPPAYLDGSDWPADFATDECGIANPNTMEYPWVEVADHAADIKLSSQDGETEIPHTNTNLWRPDAPAFVPPSMVNDNTGSRLSTELTSSAADIVNAG